jgi:hypothetical protein
MLETASELRPAGTPVRLSVGYATAASLFKH